MQRKAGKKKKKKEQRLDRTKRKQVTIQFAVLFSSVQSLSCVQLFAIP